MAGRSNDNCGPILAPAYPELRAMQEERPSPAIAQLLARLEPVVAGDVHVNEALGIGREPARDCAILAAAEQLGLVACGPWVAATRLRDAVNEYERERKRRSELEQVPAQSPLEEALEVILHAENRVRTAQGFYKVLKNREY